MDWERLSDFSPPQDDRVCGKVKHLGAFARTSKPLPSKTMSSRDPEGRGLPTLGSLLPHLSGFLVRFTELAKMEKEAKRDSGTSGPSTRISLSNSSQPQTLEELLTPGPHSPVKENETWPCSVFLPLGIILEPKWSNTLLPLFFHLNKWWLHPSSCSGQKLGSQAIFDFSCNSSANPVNPPFKYKPRIQPPWLPPPWTNSYPLLPGLHFSFSCNHPASALAPLHPVLPSTEARGIF